VLLKQQEDSSDCPFSSYAAALPHSDRTAQEPPCLVCRPGPTARRSRVLATRCLKTRESNLQVGRTITRTRGNGRPSSRRSGTKHAGHPRFVCCYGSCFASFDQPLAEQWCMRVDNIAVCFAQLFRHGWEYFGQQSARSPAREKGRVFQDSRTAKGLFTVPAYCV